MAESARAVLRARDEDTPAYQRIQNAIRERIERGELPPGAPVDSERELVPAPRAVDPRRLVQVVGDRLQPVEQDQHVEAGEPPYHEADRRAERQVRAAAHPRH